MICSSEFSLDENSVWDPKAIRQLLIISEDQLNILNNITEWTKEGDDNYFSRLKVNDSCINTQVVLNPSQNLLRNQEVVNRNTELFEKNFDSRENIIQAYKLSTLKFSSTSLFEIDKISKNSHCGNHLPRALSHPNLKVFSKDFSGQFENKSVLSQESDLSTRLNLDTLNTCKSKTCKENPNMEVVSQLPAVVPQIIKNNENFAIVDKSILSESQTIQSSGNSSNSCDLLSTLVDVNKSDHPSSTADKKTNLVEIIKLDSLNCDQNEAPVEDKQIIVCNNNNFELQENSIKISESNDLNLHEKMGTDSSIVRESTVNNNIHNTNEKVIKLSELEGLNVEKNELQTTVEENVKNNASPLSKNKNSNFDVESKILNKVDETSVEISKQPEKNELQVIVVENVINNASSSNKDKNSNNDVEDKILNKVNEIPAEVSKLPNVGSKLCESKVTVVSSNELKSKATNSSYDSKMNAGIVLNTACQGAGDGKTVILQNLPLKRKSESKARSSKRSKGSRDKQGCPDERSIKKAGEIHYCAEDMKIMFDLLKLFL